MKKWDTSQNSAEANPNQIQVSALNRKKLCDEENNSSMEVFSEAVMRVF